MPDTNLADAHLVTASTLANNNNSSPSQADIRKSISCAYSAVFHTLACVAANMLVGPIIEGRSNKAWVEVYRGLAHGTCKESCKRALKLNFPKGILDFANAFIQLQDARTLADYDPLLRPTRDNAIFCVTLARLAMEALNAAPTYDKTAFVTYVLITTNGAKQSRVHHKNGSTRGLEVVFNSQKNE